MICPILSARKMINCKEGQCSWWIVIGEDKDKKQIGQCVMNNIARELYILADLKMKEVAHEHNPAADA